MSELRQVVLIRRTGQDNAFSQFRNERQVGDRWVVVNYFFIEQWFLEEWSN